MITYKSAAAEASVKKSNNFVTNKLVTFFTCRFLKISF